MANYFNSNHTTSRFLANTNTNTPAPQSTPQNALSTAPSAVQPTTTNRSRAPASKHFSTSVNTTVPGGRSESKDAQSPATLNLATSDPVPKVYPLRNTWVFWFQHRAPGNKNVNYEEGIKKISAFSSVESFWSLWSHLAPPSALQPTTDYLLFHTGITRPVWEDPLNLTGGKWIIRLRKGITDRLWEDLVLAIIGDQFDDCGTLTQPGVETEQWPEICGCSISVRQNEDIISLWNRHESDFRLRERIRDTLKKMLNLPPTTVMEYKTNNESMQDRSSFRTTTIHHS